MIFLVMCGVYNGKPSSFTKVEGRYERLISCTEGRAQALAPGPLGPKGPGPLIDCFEKILSFFYFERVLQVAKKLVGSET